jgi:hypothetical protein
VAVHGENAITLQSLSPKHKQVAALLAQGLGRSEISNIVEFTPEYVTWLARDPLFKQYLAEMSEYADARLEALFDKTADVVANGMIMGTVDEQLKAARLQLEITGRVGKGDRTFGSLDNSVEKLDQLAQRLLALQTRVRGSIEKGATFDVQAEVVTD